MEGKELVNGKDERLCRHDRRGYSEVGILPIVGGIALLGLAALVIVALPDIKRYIRISTM